MRETSPHSLCPLPPWRLWRSSALWREGAEHFFEEGRGNRLPGVCGTLWAAFNGVTELLDHRKTRQSPHQRLSSLWFGDNYRLKTKAFALAQEKAEAWLN